MSIMTTLNDLDLSKMIMASLHGRGAKALKFNPVEIRFLSKNFL